MAVINLHKIVIFINLHKIVILNKTKTPAFRFLVAEIMDVFSFRIFKTEFNATIINNHNWEYFVQQYLSLELQMCNKQIFSTSIFIKLRHRSKTAADPGFILSGVRRKSSWTQSAKRTFSSEQGWSCKINPWIALSLICLLSPDHNWYI